LFFSSPNALRLPKALAPVAHTDASLFVGDPCLEPWIASASRPENCAPRAVRQGPPARTEPRGPHPAASRRRPTAPERQQRRSPYSSLPEEQGSRLGYAEGRPPGWV